MTYQDGEVLNPLGDVPLLGGIVGKVDQAITDMGLPLWLRALAELVITGLLAFLVLRLLTNRVLPWASTALVEPVVAVVEGFRVVLLLPDLAVSRAARRFGRVPPEPVYAYGSVVMTALDAVQQFLRRSLPMLAYANKARRWMLISLLVLGFLVWNSQTCDGPDCSAPVSVWTASFTSWLTTLV